MQIWSCLHFCPILHVVGVNMFFLPRIYTWSIVVFLFGWIYNSYVTCFVTTSSGSCIFELFQKHAINQEGLRCISPKSGWSKQTTIFWSPLLNGDHSISPPKKTRNLFTQGQNPDSNRSSENKWAQKGEAQICYVLASAKKNGRTQNRMLSFATQKMHLFGASCCPEWSGYMVLLNHVRHFGVNCLLFGAVVGLECNSCIYNR